MTGPSNRRERKKREARRRIVECAATLFASRGYDATTMEDIGDYADLSRATVFNYFPKKEDVVLDWFTERREGLADVLSRKDLQEDPTVALRRAFQALAQIFESEPENGRGMVRAWLQVGGPLLTAESDTSGLFAAAIRRGQDQGHFAKDIDPSRAGRVLFDAYLGELTRWATAEGEPPYLERSLAAILEIIVSGIATSSVSHQRQEDVRRS